MRTQDLHALVAYSSCRTLISRDKYKMCTRIGRDVFTNTILNLVTQDMYRMIAYYPTRIWRRVFTELSRKLQARRREEDIYRVVAWIYSWTRTRKTYRVVACNEARTRVCQPCSAEDGSTRPQGGVHVSARSTPRYWTSVATDRAR